MSADRRTLVIAAASMVVLVLVGVVSAALFTRSACAAITPEPSTAGVADADVSGVLATALPDVDEPVRAALLAALDDLAGAGDGAVHAADVGPATALRDLAGAVVATGPTTTVLPAPPAPASAAATFDDATIVGDGATLFSVALVNELTGQVDGVVALGDDLDAGDCTDTATVGVPLAFHLAAGDGQLLLFRVDDDGDDPHLELRDVDGPVWSTDVTLGSGPPGVLAERLRATLGDDLVVTARRSLDDEDAPALAAFARPDGEPRWEVAAEELAAHAPAGEAALEPRVVAVTDEVVVVALQREDETGPGATLLVGLDAVDGAERFTADVTLDRAPHAVGAVGDELHLLAEADGLAEILALDTTTGAAQVRHATSGRLAAGAVLGDEVVAAGDDGLVRVGAAGDAQTAAAPVRVVDVRAHDGRLAVLVRSEDGGAVIWVAPATND